MRRDIPGRRCCSREKSYRAHDPTPRPSELSPRRWRSFHRTGVRALCAENPQRAVHARFRRHCIVVDGCAGMATIVSFRNIGSACLSPDLLFTLAVGHIHRYRHHFFEFLDLFNLNLSTSAPPYGYFSLKLVRCERCSTAAETKGRDSKSWLGPSQRAASELKHDKYINQLKESTAEIAIAPVFRAAAATLNPVMLMIMSV